MKKQGFIFAIVLVQAGILFAQQETTLSAAINKAARDFGNVIPSRSWVLVLHVTSPTEALQGYLVSQLTGALAKNPFLSVVQEKNRPNLREYNLKLDEEVSSEQAGTIAAAVGVQVAITGVVAVSGNTYTLTLRAVSAQGRVLLTQNYRLRSDNTLAGLLRTAAPAAQGAPAPVAQPTPAPTPAAQPAPPPASAAQPVPAPVTQSAPSRENTSTRADPDTAHWNIAALDTAKDAAYLTDIEKDVILEMNKVRSDPKKYAELYIQPMLQYSTGEGKKAEEECITALSKINSVALLTPELGLSRAAKDQTTDQGKTGRVGHDGSDRSMPDTRMSRYGRGYNTWGENISYGQTSARDIITQLLIDLGVPSKGHRANIMNKDFTQTGVSVGTHSTYRTMCVLDYARGYIGN
jgi:uncharacterized protein YkwD